jgi:ERCC4-type nuclease
MDKLQILADNRETDVATKLSMMPNVEVIFKQIAVADFVLSDTVAIQRKTGQDLVSSIIDGRYSDLKNQKQIYSDLILIIEDKDQAFVRGQLPVKTILGAIASAIVKKKISTVFTKDVDETAILLERMAFQLQQEDKNYPVERKRPSLTLEERRLYLLQGFTGCGPEISIRLLAKYKTPWAVINAIGQNSIDVDKVGPKLKAEWRRDLGI